MLKIWTDNSKDSKEMIEKLKSHFEIQHILTASTLPVVSLENNMLVIGLGNIYRELIWDI
jgi:hypothetical protein